LQLLRSPNADFLERLKSEFPDAAIQAVEATSIDRQAMRLWWKARIATLKAAHEFAEFASPQRGDEALKTVAVALAEELEQRCV
jgi:hypothetical protein